MSIRSAAEQLCMELRKLPERKDLRELLWGLNINSRSMFGYHARNRFSQFIGYIAVDQEREQIERSSFSVSVPALTDQERGLLTSAHNQIVELNHRCVSKLISTHPHCARAIDPYNKFSFRNGTCDTELLAETAIDNVASLFQQHPAIILAIKTAPSELANLFDIKYMQDVWEMTDKLFKAGPHDSPEGFLHVYKGRNIDPEYRRAVIHLGALTSIRDSLSNLNQLIFQAVMIDNEFALDDKNVIDVSNFSFGLTGQGALVTFLPPTYIDLLGPVDIVKVQWSFNDQILNDFGRIEAYCDEPDPSFGEGNRADIRLLDDNLNSFGHLARG